MAMIDITLKMDTELKEQAETLFSELGLSMTAAITVFMKQAVYEHGIPFRVCREVPNAETLEAIDDIENGRNIYGPFNSVDEFWEDLNA